MHLGFQLGLLAFSCGQQASLTSGIGPKLVLTRETRQKSEHLARKRADKGYGGLGFSPIAWAISPAASVILPVALDEESGFERKSLY